MWVNDVKQFHPHRDTDYRLTDKMRNNRWADTVWEWQYLPDVKQEIWVNINLDNVGVHVCVECDCVLLFLAWLCPLCKTGTSFRHLEKEPMESRNPSLSFTTFITLSFFIAAHLQVLTHTHTPECPLDSFHATKTFIWWAKHQSQETRAAYFCNLLKLLLAGLSCF